MRTLGYLRVSTQEQRPDRQIDGLKSLCDELHIERASAISPKRPVYERVVAALQPGDTLAIWDLDRAFRSTVDAVLEVEKLHAREIMLRIVNLQVDTSTPSGMLVYTVMSAFAEFERKVLSQRTKEGLAAARKRGATLGRPPKLTLQMLNEARSRIAAGQSVCGVAQQLDVAPWSLTRALRRSPLPTKDSVTNDGDP